LQFKALVGQTSPGVTPVVAWTDGSPLNLYGLPVNSQTIQGVELQVAQNALAALQNAGALAGVAVPTQSPAVLLPFSTSPINLSGVFNGWAPANPNASVVYMQ
jgi:hypothetical protein